MTTKEKETESDYAKDQLLTQYGILPGTKLFMIITKVSASGMSRNIRVFLLTDTKRIGDNGITDITYNIASLVNDIYRKTKDNEVQVTGCGMDMGFALAQSVSKRLGIVVKHVWL